MDPAGLFLRLQSETHYPQYATSDDDIRNIRHQFFPQISHLSITSIHAIYSTMSSSIHLPQEHMTINSAPGIQEQTNLVTFTSLVFPDCGMLYLPPTLYLCLMSKLFHPSLLSSSTIFKITSTHHSPAHFTTNVPVAPFTLNLTYSDDYHYLSINFIHQFYISGGQTPCLAYHQYIHY